MQVDNPHPKRYSPYEFRSANFAEVASEVRTLGRGGTTMGSGTHFEQVPLDSIPKDIEVEVGQVRQRATGRDSDLWKKENLVSAPFDIFQTEAAGTPLWRGTAGTLDEAKSHIRKLAAGSPGEYMILNRRTGSKVVVPSHGTEAK
jgi:hypothetical protein